MPTRDLPKRPPDVLPCPECGGKKGHVPGCEAGALQERDYQHERVVALGGRVVRAINLLDRKEVLITFTDGVMLRIAYRQIDFSTESLVLKVQTPEEERAEEEAARKGRETLAAMRRGTHRG